MIVLAFLALFTGGSGTAGATVGPVDFELICKGRTSKTPVGPWPELTRDVRPWSDRFKVNLKKGTFLRKSSGKVQKFVGINGSVLVLTRRAIHGVVVIETVDRRTGAYSLTEKAGRRTGASRLTIPGYGNPDGTSGHCLEHDISG